MPEDSLPRDARLPRDRPGGYNPGMAEQDLGYKLLFAHREMVADLLSGFIREPWVAEVELDTLERVSGSYVSDDLREREDDIIWRVRWRGGWLYVYVLLEFQATVDRFMALRMLVYVGLLYQDLIRSKQLTPDGRLPPVVPVVLYNGEDRWTAAREISELIEAVPGGLEKYRPQMQYLLLEERQYQDSELASMRNLVAALFRLENSRGPEELFRVIEALIEWLQTPEQADLSRAFVVWLRRSFLVRRIPGVEVPEIENLQEARTMLAERVKDWTEQWREEGREKGRQEGRQEGEAALLTRQLERRFGALAATVRDRIAHADSDQLLMWGERVLTAQRVEEVLE
jgi:predicted transposase/invertase (TIGR01784 family)